MQAEVKAELGAEGEAIQLLNQIRQRAFGNSEHAISASGEALKEAILQERKLELLMFHAMIAIEYFSYIRKNFS